MVPVPTDGFFAGSNAEVSDFLSSEALPDLPSGCSSLFSHILISLFFLYGQRRALPIRCLFLKEHGQYRSQTFPVQQIRGGQPCFGVSRNVLPIVKIRK